MNTFIFLIVFIYGCMGLILFRNKPNAKLLQEVKDGLKKDAVNFPSFQVNVDKTFTAEEQHLRNHLQEHWSKCPFCGASNGKFNKPLEEHRARCRYVGSADNREISKPNYFKFIEEDNVGLLQSMKERSELIVAKKEIAKLKDKIDNKKDPKDG